ncbi:MAG: DUF4288 domain-containing protein [Chloroflexales bacterium]|nr:DUF4288 domain-containing protein [Chloroflexales bacterium]
MVSAPDVETAYAESFALGKAEEHSYANADNEMVFSEFVGLQDLDVLEDDTITNGAEIRSRFLLERSDASDLVRPQERLQVYL